MSPKQQLNHPVTFETGAGYILRDFLDRDRKIAWVPVKFVSYAPCPGIVIVADACGSKLTVQREDVFSTGCT